MEGALQELPDLDARGLTVADVTRASYWIDADGRPHRGERGVAMDLIEVGGLWAVAGRALLTPPIRTSLRPCTDSSRQPTSICREDPLPARSTTAQKAT
jgi:hypothetical protein